MQAAAAALEFERAAMLRDQLFQLDGKVAAGKSHSRASTSSRKSKRQ